MARIESDGALQFACSFGKPSCACQRLTKSKAECRRIWVQLGGFAKGFNCVRDVVLLPVNDPDVKVRFAEGRVLGDGCLKFFQTQVLRSDFVSQHQSQNEVGLGEAGPQAKGLTKCPLGTRRVAPKTQGHAQVVVGNLGVRFHLSRSFELGYRAPMVIPVEVILA